MYIYENYKYTTFLSQTGSRMHLATLMTNTDESDFAQNHPKDGEKFQRMINAVRPAWRTTSYAVKDGVFPDDITAFDGVMITGSPASMLDDAPWIAELLNQISTAHAAGVPLFGACFGHQAIAAALGGKVEKNPKGWAFGVVEMTVSGDIPWYVGSPFLTQYAAHIDHVTQLPPGARQIFTAPHCDHAGFVMGQSVYTTQNHPEMTPAFMQALMAEYADKLPADVATRAQASLTKVPDQLAFSESIARFFETALAD